MSRSIIRSGPPMVWALCVTLACSAQPESQPAPPTYYSFASWLGDGDSVAYVGQTHRHVLIKDLSLWMSDLTDAIDSGTSYEAGAVLTAADFYLAFDGSVGGAVSVHLKTAPAPLQKLYQDIGDANLNDKIAGNDPVGQHRDFTKQLRGWSGQTSAEGLLRSWLKALDKAAAARSEGDLGQDPDGKPLKHVFVTPEGLDLKQLIEKFLGGALCFSQGVDDYLDDDVQGKGLLADNTQPASDGALYTALAHQWDEGFGYFGAARDFADYTDEEIAGKGGRAGWNQGYHDTDGDGAIDLRSEYIFGHAANAGKRDLGALGKATIDYSGAAWRAFAQGRALIARTRGPLNDAELTQLKTFRDEAVQAWEAAIAATAIHYVNETLRDMELFGTDAYDFYGHAKHWSELKGFALGLQFHRRSPMKAFDDLHASIGDKPVLASASQVDVEAYKAALRHARDLLMQAYQFPPELRGDEKGEGGW